MTGAKARNRNRSTVEDRRVIRQKNLLSLSLAGSWRRTPASKSLRHGDLRGKRHLLFTLLSCQNRGDERRWTHHAFTHSHARTDRAKCQHKGDCLLIPFPSRTACCCVSCRLTGAAAGFRLRKSLTTQTDRQESSSVAQLIYWRTEGVAVHSDQGNEGASVVVRPVSRSPGPPVSASGGGKPTCRREVDMSGWCRGRSACR